MNDVLLYFSLKYNGDWKKIYTALETKEKVSLKNLDEISSKINENFVTILDDKYPSSLKQIYRPPFVIFYKGNYDLLSNEKRITFYSNCESNSYNIRVVKQLITKLAQKEIPIVTSSTSSLTKQLINNIFFANGNLIYVLECGLNDEYFQKNLVDWEILKEKHLIISEYPYFVAPSKKNKNDQHRIAIGLGQGILIPDATHSFSMTLVSEIALNEGKDIYCVPNEINKNSACNSMIKQGAKLVENVYDILNEISPKLN